MAKLLVINLGGSSSKLAIYDDKKCLADKSIQHTQEEMAANPLSKQQVAYRSSLIKAWMTENGYDITDFDAIAIRATPIRQAVHGGTYKIEGRYRELVLEQYFPDQKPVHGTRLAVPVAETLMGDHKIPMYVTDPGGSNELPPVARVTGLKEFPRFPTGHALNQKAVARRYAEMIGKPYKDCKIVVVHLGSGITVGAHENGGIVDLNEGGDGYGPFSPLRAGTIESRVMLDLCFDFGMTKAEVKQKIRNEAGTLSHLGTDDMRVVEKMAQVDSYAALVYEAMAYNIAKSVGARVAILKGNIDGILITGAIAHSNVFINKIKAYVEQFAPVAAYPGEFENEALAYGALRVISGEEEPQTIIEDLSDFTKL